MVSAEDIIQKTVSHIPLSDSEIINLVTNYTNGKITNSKIATNLKEAH